MLTKEEIRAVVAAVGAVAVGFARADEPDATDMHLFDRWVEARRYAGMDYMARHRDLRFRPELLLPECRTVVSCAFSYNPTELRRPTLPTIARFAAGRDYHKVIPRRLRGAVKALTDACGGNYRICVDSAPVRERYWAVKSGIAFRGRNGLVMVPGYGSYVFLAEILTDLEIEPDEACADWCLSCGKCLAACPGEAIRADATLDCGRCRSYLTIEHRGPMPEGWEGEAMFGCDICQTVCPHNRDAAPTGIEEFASTELYLSLDRAQLEAMTDGAPLNGTALKRAGREQLLRNITPEP